MLSCLNQQVPNPSFSKFPVSYETVKSKINLLLLENLIQHNYILRFFTLASTIRCYQMQRYWSLISIVNKVCVSWMFRYTNAQLSQSSFPLIQPSFVKLTQLAEYDKTSHACQWMTLVNVWGTASTECSVAYLVEHQTYNPGFYSHQSFVSVKSFA